MLARAYGVSDPTEVVDPEYVDGLRAAVVAAIDYGLAGVEDGEGRPPPVPVALLSQVRLAVRNAVSLDTVLRRCFAGYTLFGDFLVEEAEQSGLPRDALKCLLRSQATLFDRLVSAVTDEHSREQERQGQLAITIEQRHAERIKRLLAGELPDTSDFAYDFAAHHLGAIAKGPGVGEALRELAKLLDRRLLTVRHGGDTEWAWFGGRHEVDLEKVEHQVSASWRPEVALAIGEPGEGLGGWRLTHQQARAALPIALRSPADVVRYADVALVASMLQDNVLATSLRQLYLAPLQRDRDGGRVARETLRAYFEADRNAASAAALLGVSRQAVSKRLQSIERMLARPLGACANELDAVLRLEELSDSPA